GRQMRPFLGMLLLSLACLTSRGRAADSLVVEGGPADTGYNVGSTATIRAGLIGAQGDPARYSVFADIQYTGTTAVASVEMDRQPRSMPDELRYEARWPVPADAPTGVYTVTVHVEDRSTRETVATRKLRSFGVYRPLVPAGSRASRQGTRVAVLGAGGPARHEKIAPPEVDHYTLAVWNADRTVLDDMQFSPRAIVRDPDRDFPKPYSNNFTHPYNSDIDFTKYREFYAPGEIPRADAKTEVALNKLPQSLLVFCPHEDDEHPWAGLIRAMVEASRP